MNSFCSVVNKENAELLVYQKRKRERNNSVKRFLCFFIGMIDT